MIIKPRDESLELRILRSLHARMKLGEKEENYYFNLEKGYKGEFHFDRWVKPLLDNRIVLSDVLLECNNTLFQVDSLLISSSMIYLFEVKNYEGDFYIEGDRWYSLSGGEIKNPLLQLKRNESLLRRLLQEHGLTFPIESYLIFVNSEFHLYQTPLNLPIIFPTQFNRFINKISKTHSKLRNTHLKVADQLVSLHLNETPYIRLPKFHYDDLKKGIICPACQSFYTTFINTNLLAVFRSVQEFKLLFPDRKITTNVIYDWCRIIKNKKTIRKILSKNFKIIMKGRASYYVNRD